MPLEILDERHRQAAVGYVKLGMYRDGNREHFLAAMPTSHRTDVRKYSLLPHPVAGRLTAQSRAYGCT